MARRQIERIKSILNDLESYFEDGADVKDQGNSQVMNAEGQMLMKITHAKDLLNAIHIPLTVAELMRRVEDKAKQQPDIVHELDKEGGLLALTCRYVAWVEAHAISESCYTIRDWTDLIVDGEKIAGPFKTEKDLRDWIDLKDEIEPWVGWDEELDADLDDFFGLKKPPIEAPKPEDTPL